MGISDELRGLVNLVNCCGLKGQEWGDKFTSVADRIDREMIELPKDADGVPIHVGDTVWGYASGIERVVTGMNLTDKWALFTDSVCIGRSTDVTHTRPDSLERIADDIEDFCVDYEIKGDHEAFDRVMDFAYRIRKLGCEIEEER